MNKPFRPFLAESRVRFVRNTGLRNEHFVQPVPKSSNALSAILIGLVLLFALWVNSK